MLASTSLARPMGAMVTFDSRSGRTTTGLPLEHIKAGTLAGLVDYLCFYAARARRTELVTDAKLGLDEEYATIFWTMFPAFTSVRDVGAELLRVADRAVANRDHVWAVAVSDAVAAGIDPVNRFLLWLPPHQQAELVAAAERVAHTLQRGFRAWEAPVHPPGSVPVLAAARQPEALADLEAKIMLARVAVDIASTNGVTAHLLPTTVLTLLAEFVGTQDGSAAPGTTFGSASSAALSGAASGASSSGAGSGAGGLSSPLAGASPRTSLPGLADMPAGGRLSLRAGRPSTLTGVPSLGSPTAAGAGSVRSPLADGVAGHATADAGTPDLHTTFDTLWAVPYDLLAAQWTYIEHALFRAIPASEFLACGWDKARYEHASDAFRRYADHFNAMSLWVTAEVLSQGSNAARAAMIVRFVKTGVCLRRYNNFSGLVQLCLGLRRDIVVRLTDVWDLIPPAARERLDALYALTDDRKNYRSYKEALKMLPPTAPVVPHLGAHTAELTMQDQLLTNDISGAGGVSLLHFRRQRELHKLFSPIFAMQEGSYGSYLPPQVPAVINMLNATARAFYCAFDDDRDEVLQRLEAASHAIQAPPPPPPPMEVGPIVTGEYVSTAPPLPGDAADGGDGDGGGGGGRGRGLRRVLTAGIAGVMRLMSPARRRREAGEGDASGAAQEGDEGGVGRDGGGDGDGGADVGGGDGRR